MSDPRFSKAGKDPRFRKAAIADTKAEIDPRFKAVLTDKKFRAPRNQKPTGKPVHKDDSDQDDSFKWDAASSSSEESVDDIEQELTEYNAGVDPTVWEETVEDTILSEDASARLAVLGCDWDKIQAADIFSMFQTFLDSLGKKRVAAQRAVHSVNFYPSEFGKTEMEWEAQHGPRLEVDDDDESMMTAEELQAKENRVNEALRKYQKQRRKYYYAVVVFDSVETANLVYTELDGCGASFCATLLDLRFVPDSLTEFPYPAISTCNEAPGASYKSPLEDGGAAATFSHSKVACSWDEDLPERKILRRKLTPKEIAELDLSAYIASDSEADAPSDTEAYRKALLSGDESTDGEVEMGDMEMKVNRNVENIGKKIEQGKSSSKSLKNLSAWEQYLEKRKEEKRQKTMMRKMSGKRDVDGTSGALDAEELEKLLPSKKAKTEKSGDKTEDAEKITQDPRLQAIFQNPDFAVDTTHPAFDKKSQVMRQVLAEKSKRRRK